ncbi:glycosyltransferase [Rhodopseudomonas palustris]|uniref:Glycosyl transferase, group 1 n=1 Tax=Rhodopseudomonas palustris (strain BisB18) TaxID=316056 RepID=Q20YR3_RHOPB
MRIHIIARDIQRFDAVGNFCRQIHALLLAQGYDASLAAENCHPDDRALIAKMPETIGTIGADDLVILHFSTEDPAFPAIAALPCAKILYFHNITPERFFAGIDERTAGLVRQGLQQRPLAAGFDVLMANSRATAQVLHDGLPPQDQRRITEAAIVACPPLIGADRWDGIVDQPSNADADARTVLYVGRLVPHKGVTQLLDGFATLAAHDAGVRLVCVGGPPDQAYAAVLSARIAALPPSIAQRIEFLHGLSDGALKSLYRNAGVCASMSRHEGFGVPLLDALSFDKPLVINSEAGMIETAGDAALVVDASDAEAVANALAAALDDEATRAQLGAARRLRLPALRRQADGHLILNAVTQARTLHRARIV